MQVERFLFHRGLAPPKEKSGERVSNAWVTCPSEGDNTWKQVLIPYNTIFRMKELERRFCVTDGWARGALASW